MKAINRLHFFPTPKPNGSSLSTAKLNLKPAHNLSRQSNIHRVVSITTPESSPVLENHRPNNATINSNPSNELQENIQESVTAYWDYQFLFVSQRARNRRTGTTSSNPRRKEFNIETGEWTFTHRGPFSVLRGGKKFGNTKVMKNVANTSVLKWGGKLLCLWEGGDPYEIDIENGHLDTVGIFDLINRHHLQPEDIASGGINRISKDAKEVSGDCGGGGFWDVAASVVKPILHGIFKMPPKRLLSHYKIDPGLDRLITVSCNAEDMLIPRSSFTFYAHFWLQNLVSFKLLQKQEFDIFEHMMIHDWAFTETHYIVFGNRIKLDVPDIITLVIPYLICRINVSFMWIISNDNRIIVNPNKPTSPIYLLPRFPDKVQSDRDWKIPIEAPSQMWVLHAGNAFELKDQGGNLEIQIHAAICSYKWFNFHKMFGYDWKTGRLNPAFMNARDDDEKTLPHLEKMCYMLILNPKMIGRSEDALVAKLEVPKHLNFPLGFHGFWAAAD
ncbi:hypothetical protein MKX01_033767 [Papaver californicum]|nr:hypothetical protein MKX01_033767 [Papaver californicum]